MSVVERLSVVRVATPLVRPFVTAVRRADAIDVVLVQAVDTEGRTGWGEAAVSWRVTGESPESVAAVVAGPLAEAVVGRAADEDDIEQRLAAAAWGNAAARSAVSCALADLAAQRRGIRLMTDAVDRIRTDMTLSAAPVVELTEKALAHANAGFGCLKVKVVAGMDVVAALGAVRAALGPAVRLRIDANQAWTVDEAIRAIRACEDAGLDIEFVEQPVAAADLAGLARVTAAVGTPVMADESVRTAADVREIASRGAAGLVNVKLAKTGGLREAVAAIETARAAGLGVIVGCMMESHVGVAAAAHLAAAHAPATVHDLDAALWLARSPVRGGIGYRADELVLSAGAGLGIEGLAFSSEGGAAS